MEREHVTLSVPKDVLRQAKMIAAKRGTSLSSLLTEAIEEMVRAEDRYDAAMRRSLRLMEKGVYFGPEGFKPVPRDELHER